LAQASRLVAKVDSAAVQTVSILPPRFIVTDDDVGPSIQQGMMAIAKQARRYHRLSEGLQSFVGRSAYPIDGRAGQIINLADRGRGIRHAQLNC